MVGLNDRQYVRSSFPINGMRAFGCRVRLRAAAQRQQNSTTSLLQVAAAADCTRSSFSGWPCLSALPSSAGAMTGQTTFRPVIAAAARSLSCSDAKSELLVGACPPAWSSYDGTVLTSDDESRYPLTRKRRHGDSSDDAPASYAAASDDDEEIRTILCDEATMTSRAPDNGAVMTSEKRHCSPLLRARITAAAVINECSIVQRPSLNLYKMQVSSSYYDYVRGLHADS